MSAYRSVEATYWLLAGGYSTRVALTAWTKCFECPDPEQEHSERRTASRPDRYSHDAIVIGARHPRSWALMQGERKTCFVPWRLIREAAQPRDLNIGPFYYPQLLVKLGVFQGMRSPNADYRENKFMEGDIAPRTSIKR
jgi:hypothetical protein